MLTKNDYFKIHNKLTDKKIPVISESTGPRMAGSWINPLMVGLIVFGYFMLGVEYREVDKLKNQLGGRGGVDTQVNPTIAPQAVAPQKPAIQPTVNPESVEKVSSNDHLQGDLKSQLQLIVYSDLECPYSKRFQTTTIKQVLDQYKDKVTVVYRHFPLDSIHPQARKEAQATECAAKLAGNNGFWKLTNKIYEITPSNNGLDLTQLPIWAVQAGINKLAFQNCLDGNETAQIVENQYRSGLKAGIQGTPGSFLVDNKTGSVQLISGALPFEQIKPMIDKALVN